MRTVLTSILIAMLVTLNAFAASTYTTDVYLEKPGYGDTNWHTPTNSNWDLMNDLVCKGNVVTVDASYGTNTRTNLTDHGQPYLTITAAIAAPPVSGDVVLVYPGDYSGESAVTVPSGVVLVSLGATLPTISSGNYLSFEIDGDIATDGDWLGEYQDDSVNDDDIDFGTSTDQVSAVDLPIASMNFAASNVEDALEENLTAIENLEDGDADLLIVSSDARTGAYTTIPLALAAADDGDVILLMPGTYTLTTQLDLTSNQVSIRGVDREQSIISWLNMDKDTDGDDALANISRAILIGNGVTISNLTINIAASDITTPYFWSAIGVGSTTDDAACTVTDVDINVLQAATTGFASGILLGDAAAGATNNVQLNVHRCHIRVTGAFWGIGVQLHSPNTASVDCVVTVTDCEIHVSGDQRAEGIHGCGTDNQLIFKNNRIWSTQGGIDFDVLDDDDIKVSVCDGNVIYTAPDGTANGGSSIDYFGIAVGQGIGNRITNNTIDVDISGSDQAQDGAGIRLGYTSGTAAGGNYIANNLITMTSRTDRCCTGVMKHDGAATDYVMNNQFIFAAAGESATFDNDDQGIEYANISTVGQDDFKIGAGSTGVMSFAGDQDIDGEIEGDKLLLEFGHATRTTSQWLKVGGQITSSTTIGYAMPRAGSIVSVSCMFYVYSHSDTGTLRADIYHEGVVDYATGNESIAADGTYSVQIDQARGVDTFAAGDIISCQAVKVGGTFTYHPFVVVEVVFDD